MIKRPELTDEEKREAEALKKIWNKKKKELRERGIKLTQESAAEELGFDTQGAVSQYLNGKIRLNLDAIIKFSKLLGCKPNDIRPSLDILVDETARPISPIAIDKDKTHQEQEIQHSFDFLDQIKDKVSPRSQAMLEQLKQALKNGQLTDEMAQDIEGYLKTKLATNPLSPEQKEKQYQALKAKLKPDQDE